MITLLNECYYCTHKIRISGNAHIACASPDSEMEGEQYGKINGWFYYPIVFDPIWKSKKCKNFKLSEDVKRIEE